MYCSDPKVGFYCSLKAQKYKQHLVYTSSLSTEGDRRVITKKRLRNIIEAWLLIN